MNLYEKLNFTLLQGMIEAIGDKKEYQADIADLPDETGVFSKVEVGFEC